LAFGSAPRARSHEGGVAMADTTVVAGIEIPSTSPIFLTIVGLHVLIGSVCVVSGIVAMLSPKRAGRHPTFGSIYFWSLSLAFLSATILSAIRWKEDYHLFILGTLAFAAAIFARQAIRRRGPYWTRVHITGMGTSYVLLLTAFYVDNGKSLPLWEELPSIAYWILPAIVGIPLIVRALLRHPLARHPSHSSKAA
jgi:hypothetical protein